MQVLISPAGTSDPIRDYYDGPMLHIIRHYKPETVYILLTKEMEEKDRLDNRYEEYIKVVMPECIVRKVYTGIEDPSDFDLVPDIYQKIIYEIIENNQGASFLANVTSGTPQMISALCVVIALSNTPIQAIQVVTPQRAANNSIPYFEEDASIGEIMELNYDQNEATATRRTVETHIHLFRKNFLFIQLEQLIRNYDYYAALELAKLNQHLVPEDVRELLQHAQRRSSMLMMKSNPPVKGHKTEEIYPVRDNQGARYLIFEYFNIIKLSLNKKNYPDILLKMSPLLSEVAVELLKQQCGIELYLANGKVNLDALKSYEKDLFFYVNNYFSDKGGLKEGYLMLSNLIPFLEFYASRQQIDTKLVMIFKELREYERAYRNKLAHEIASTNDNDLKEKAKQISRFNSSYSKEMNFEILVNKMEQVVLRTLNMKSIKNIYDTINEWLVTALRGD